MEQHLAGRERWQEAQPGLWRGMEALLQLLPMPAMEHAMEAHPGLLDAILHSPCQRCLCKAASRLHHLCATIWSPAVWSLRVRHKVFHDAAWAWSGSDELSTWSFCKLRAGCAGRLSPPSAAFH